jgi:signal peptidase II
MKDNKNIWVRFILVSIGVVIADQITKYIVKITIPMYGRVGVIDNFFDLTHILNPGGAFGLLAGQSPEIRKFVFLFISSFVALSVLWFYKLHARQSWFMGFGLALVFGGAVGNLIDRFCYGKVLDFLDFYLGSLHWPAFNVADSAITTGMAVLVIHTIFDSPRTGDS